MGDALFGPRKDQHAPQARWSFLVVLSVAIGIILPWLGSTGFFDPWETNYAEVAREMVVRDDYLYPFWKDAHFFSKPILLFWLEAPLFRLLGAGEPGPMSGWIELAARLPTALVGIVTVLVVWQVAARFWSRRAATIGAILLVASPYWAFLSRQAITDMLYVGTFSVGIVLLLPWIVGDEDERAAAAERRLPWWVSGLIAAALLPQAWEIARSVAILNDVAVVGSERVTRVVIGVVAVAAAAAVVVWVHRRARDPALMLSALAFALSMLAKGPVGVAIAVVVIVVAVAFIDGVVGVVRLLVRPSLGFAALVFFCVCAPWPIVMSLYEGLDESRKTWFDRFVRYDLLGRVGAGVHGDRGGVEYYVRSLGFGLFPWVGLVPIAFVEGLQGLRRRALDPQGRLLAFCAVWAAGTFLFFSLTTTKFHHYALPCAVPFAMLVGKSLDRLADDTPRAQLVIGGFAAVIGVIIWRELMNAPWEWIDLFTYHYKGYKPEYYFPVKTLDLIEVIPAIGKSPAVSVSAFPLLIGVAGAVALVWPAALALRQWLAGPSAAADRGDHHDDDTYDVLAVGGVPGAGLVTGVVVGSVFCTVLAVHGFMARASQHWSQRWIMDTYHALRHENEQLIAFQMDWKGETFYSKNTEFQIKKDVADLRAAIARPGRDFVLVQTDRLPTLKAAVGTGADTRVKVVDKSNAKWLLVVVD